MKYFIIKLKSNIEIIKEINESLSRSDVRGMSQLNEYESLSITLSPRKTSFHPLLIIKNNTFTLKTIKASSKTKHLILLILKVSTYPDPYHIHSIASTFKSLRTAIRSIRDIDIRRATLLGLTLFQSKYIMS